MRTGLRSSHHIAALHEHVRDDYGALPSALIHVLFLAVLVMVKGFHVPHIYEAFCILSYSAFLCHIHGLS